MKYNLTYIINNEHGKYEYDGGEWEKEEDTEKVSLKQIDEPQKRITLNPKDQGTRYTETNNYIHIPPLYLDGIEYYFEKVVDYLPKKLTVDNKPSTKSEAKQRTKKTYRKR